MSCKCNTKIELKIKKLTDDAIIPEFKSSGAAGMDICSIEDFCLEPQTIHIFKTGISVEVPEGYEVQVRPRSGLACKHGVTVVNSPGTIDSDYRGEVGVALINLSSINAFQVNKGDRIAQLVINKIELPEVSVVEDLSETERGAAGFGSTGIK